MSSFNRELKMAMDAAQRARRHIDLLDQSSFDSRQKRAMRLLKNRLDEAASGIPKDFDTPVKTVYSAVRQALSEIDKLERQPLDEEQRARLADAIVELHEAEDALHEAFWRG